MACKKIGTEIKFQAKNFMPGFLAVVASIGKIEVGSFVCNKNQFGDKEFLTLVGKSILKTLKK